MVIKKSHLLIASYACILSLTTNTFAAKPPPKPAEDLVCTECVDTVDIKNDAVTIEKLSADLQQLINQLSVDLNALQAQVDQQPQQPVLVDSTGAKVGDVLTTDFGSNATDIHSAVISVAPESGLEAHILFTPDHGFTGVWVLYDQPFCEGNAVGIIEAGGILTLSGTKNFGNPPTGMMVYVPDNRNPPTLIYSASAGMDTRCKNWGVYNEQLAYPLLQAIDLSGESFVPPYRIVAAP